MHVRPQEPRNQVHGKTHPETLDDRDLSPAAPSALPWMHAPAARARAVRWQRHTPYRRLHGRLGPHTPPSFRGMVHCTRYSANPYGAAMRSQVLSTALPFGSQLALPVGFGFSAWRCHSVFRRSVWLAELAAPRSQLSAASLLTLGLVAHTPWRRNQVLSMALPFGIQPGAAIRYSGAQHGAAVGSQQPCFACFVLLLLCPRAAMAPCAPPVALLHVRRLPVLPAGGDQAGLASAHVNGLVALPL